MEDCNLKGGASEGEQNSKLEGLIPDKGEVKTDAKLPAYCNSPNPCPIGFSANDGCIQRFENTAAFSREYQAAQECFCDFAHMMNCPWSPTFSSYHILDVKRMFTPITTGLQKQS